MATLQENATAVKTAQEAIDAAIVAKGGSTAGGLNNAAAAIAAIPTGGEPIDMDYDGADTKINIDIDDPSCLNFTFRSSGTNIVINWGDGTQTTGDFNSYHTYPSLGKYTITISGQHYLFGVWWDMTGPSTPNSRTKNKPCFRGFYVGNTCNKISFWNMQCLDYVVFAKSFTGETSVAGFGAFGVEYCSVKTIANIFSIGEANNFGAHLYSLETMTVRNGATILGTNNFSYCYKLKTLDVPDSVTTIGNYTFYKNGLRHLKIGSGITTIGMQAFSGAYAIYPICEDLTIMATTPPTIQSSTFTNFFADDAKIIVPAGCGDAYKAADNWSVYADIIEEAS